jgi:S1-C subfamily serine protease
MRKHVAVPVLCAVLGGVATAAVLLAAGAVDDDSPVVQQATTLLTSGPVGGTAAGDVYRSEADGVVGVSARALAVPPSAFDVGDRRSDGLRTGSGFVLDRDGHVVTAAHLVRAADDVEVSVAGQTLPAQVLGTDETTDVAVLRVRTAGVELHALELGDSDTVRVGDPAIAIGHAAGLAPTLTTGTVSARQPRVEAPGGATIADALQVDASLRPVDCGGPLLDAGGRVTGVNTRMLTAGGETVDLAVPVNTLRRLLPELSGKALKVVNG